MYRIEKYNTTHYSLWNDFIADSKNGTFLFQRDFMEYHSDRFNDYSLLVFQEDKLMAVLPANEDNGVVYSHQGLTYGGLIYTPSTKQLAVTEIFNVLVTYLKNNGINRLYLKQVPAIYHKYPAQEAEFTLFNLGAKLVRRDGVSVYDQENPLPFTKKRKEAIRRGEKNKLTIVEEPEFGLFWDKVLIPNLERKHEARPVHTLEEIKMLYSKFPQNIRHFNVYHNGKIVAGTTMFVTDTVAKPQYISATPDKNELGSIDYLYSQLITTLFKDKRYFDLGPSFGDDRKTINEGVLFWKESFGARIVVQDFYELEIG